eukprot:gene5263-6092_t
MSTSHLLISEVFSNDPISPGAIPSSVTKLYFHQTDPILQVGSLPPFLQTLKLGSFDRSLTLPSLFPTTLVELTFGNDFDQPLLPGVLPPSLVVLNFGNSFDQILEPGSIPESVRFLKFGLHFNKPIAPGVLPQSQLTELTFGLEFKQQLQIGSIPLSVTRLVFGAFYNRPLLPGVLPPSLTDLDFGNGDCGSYDHPLGPDILPQSLLRLCVGTFSQNLEYGYLPSSLRCLDIRNATVKICVLPESLTTLAIGDTFKFKRGQPIPRGLHTLSINQEWLMRSPKNIILPSIVTLTLKQARYIVPYGRQTILIPSGIIPDTVKHLHILDFQGLAEPGAIPHTVKTLSIKSGIDRISLAQIEHPLDQLIVHQRRDDRYVDFPLVANDSIIFDYAHQDTLGSKQYPDQSIVWLISQRRGFQMLVGRACNDRITIRFNVIQSKDNSEELVLVYSNLLKATFFNIESMLDYSFINVYRDIVGYQDVVK